MALLAICMPILPGKREKWQAMMDKLKEEPLKSQVAASREAAGVHERTFLQETPGGDMVIITLEGDNPGEAFGKMMSDPSMQDFLEWAVEVHGVDPNTPAPMPQLLWDSKA